ncbi:MAG: T9SS type A sorting domain-containing protein [Muribaculaceae bacterium]|nr:T9SS type A sorting domain-containing protein [Muribaculaceae bacterium]
MRITLFLLSLLAFIPVRADEDDNTCLILTGDNQEEFTVDLKRFRRITFGENSMTLSNPVDPQESIELLYSAYNQVKIGELSPNTEIKTAAKDEPVLNYLRDKQLLTLTPTVSPVAIGVFSTDGRLVSKTSSGSLSVAGLNPGTYVAIAVSGEAKLTLKFIK